MMSLVPQPLADAICWIATPLLDYVSRVRRFRMWCGEQQSVTTQLQSFGLPTHGAAVGSDSEIVAAVRLTYSDQYAGLLTPLSFERRAMGSYMKKGLDSLDGLFFCNVRSVVELEHPVGLTMAGAAKGCNVIAATTPECIAQCLDAAATSGFSRDFCRHECTHSYNLSVVSTVSAEIS